MHIDLNDFKAVKIWALKAKEEGWKRPREIVELAELLAIGFEPGIGYCDVCHRVVADFDALASTKRMDEPEAAFRARLEGGREGYVGWEEAICCTCMPTNCSEGE